MSPESEKRKAAAIKRGVRTGCRELAAALLKLGDDAAALVAAGHLTMANAALLRQEIDDALEAVSIAEYRHVAGKRGRHGKQ